MASYNRIIIMGNLTRDPEHKQLQSGQAVCRLGVATNRQFKNRQTGQNTQEVCFIDIDVWGQQAESCKQYLSKGRSVLIEGRLKYDTWQDPDGQKRSKHSIVADRVTFLGSGAQDDAEAESTETEFRPAAQAAAPKAVKRSAPVGGFGGMASQDSISDMGEVPFSDEKPFEDDLPF